MMRSSRQNAATPGWDLRLYARIIVADLAALLTGFLAAGVIAGTAVAAEQELPHPPTKFVFRSSWPGYSRGDAVAVQVVGHYAYVAQLGYGGLMIVDVSDPAKPVESGGYDTAGSGNDLHVVGNYAYVADGEAGLLALDVSNPANIVLAGSYDPKNGS